MIYAVIAILGVLVIWIISSYNFFVSSKARIKASIQEIGNQLKRQADLIPNLEASVKGYLKHETGIFDKLTEARKAIDSAIKSGSVQKMADAGKNLADLLPKIQVLVESNPEIKGVEVVNKLMEELRDTADKIMYSRRLVIDLTADFNVKRATFPTNLVANLFKFAEQPGIITPLAGEHIKAEGQDLITPKVNL